MQALGCLTINSAESLGEDEKEGTIVRGAGGVFYGCGVTLVMRAVESGNAVMGDDRETVQVVILLKSKNTTNRQLQGFSFAFISRFDL